jgi:putative transposase
VVQRGNNRLPCFLDDEDRQRYLQCLRQALLRFGCRLHVYVVLSSHVHLLFTPEEAGGISRLMLSRAITSVRSNVGRVLSHSRGQLSQGRKGPIPNFDPASHPGIRCDHRR